MTKADRTCMRRAHNNIFCMVLDMITRITVCGSFALLVHCQHIEVKPNGLRKSKNFTACGGVKNDHRK
jgi:hypothetical protein